jgi:hypothetical protein
MKRLILSATLILLGTSAMIGAIAPVTFANQVSTPSELSPTATTHDLVQNNRDMRGGK